MADTRDEKVREVYERARAKISKDAAPGERAESLRRFVHAFIRTKSLGVGFATASETARTAEGDCSEHGVLLTTLLRCDGIRSRAVSGLIYVHAEGKGVFGYHMWSQALLELDGKRRWVDLDATLPDATPYDATHIALGVTDLSGDDPLTSMMNVATMLGRLRISIPKPPAPMEHAPDAR
jgi:transglutaminase-like putative cysteine protease